MKTKFTFAQKELEQASESLSQALEGTKAEAKEIRNAQLLLEELSMLLWENGNADTPIEVCVSSFFGQVSVELGIKGEEYNPISQENIWNEEDENYYRRIIVCANREKLSYNRKNGKNRISIRVHESSGKRTYLTLAAMALGIVAGLALQGAASKASVDFVDSNFLYTIKTLFLNGIKMIVGPVVFLSIVGSIASMTDLAALGRMGGKMVLIYSLTTFLAALVGTGMGFLFSLGAGSLQAETAAEAAELTTTAFSLKDTVLGIIPNNILSPFTEGNMTQIIFIAVFVGIALSILNEKTTYVSELIGQMNEVFLKMIALLMRCIPLVAFCSMMSVTATLGADSLLVIVRLVIGHIAGCAAMLLVYSALLLLAARISPIPFLKKIPSFLPIPMSLASSNATMPATIQFCTEKMGISEKISSFSIPLGATINMDGTAALLPLVAVLFMKEYGMTISLNMLVTLIITTYLLTVSTPGVPGGGIICISTVVVALQIPAACIGIVVGVYQILDMFNTALNCTGDISATFLVSKSEKMLDEEVYKKV